MSVLNDKREEMASAITAAGLVAVTDVTQVTPPCVLIGPPDIESVLARGECISVEAAYPVIPLVVGPANGDAVEQLMTMLRTTIIALAGHRIDDATPLSYVVGTREFPAYEVTIRKTVRL